MDRLMMIARLEIGGTEDGVEGDREFCGIWEYISIGNHYNKITNYLITPTHHHNNNNIPQLPPKKNPSLLNKFEK